MFLRYTTRKKNGKEHRYYSLVENRRVASGRVVQRHALYLGEINDTQQEAWRKTIEIFEEGKTRPRTVALFPEDRIGPIQDEQIVRIRLKELSLHRPRQWGGCWLAVALWEQLGLDQFWAQRLPPSRKGTRWDWVLQILVIYRLLDPGSEWRLYRHWFEHSALRDLLGVEEELAEIHKLYECHERLLAHKKELFTHLSQRWKDLFNAQFEVLLYDLTSTYFESDPPFAEGDKRRYGYSRDKRSDCVQVVVALIVTPEGFPVAYEVLAGNTSDKTTLEDFLKKIQEQYGQAQRIWVMDRGIPTEKTLEQMRQTDPPVYYLVGTPRGRLTQYEQKLARLPWQVAREGVSVKLLSEGEELYVLAQSQDRVNKERAMRRSQLKRVWRRLKQLQTMKLKRDELLKKLGAALHEYPAAARFIQSSVEKDSAQLNFGLLKDKLRRARKREGRYLLRSNMTTGRSAEELWQFYIQLTEVEAAFKNLKDDLALRPIYHQLEQRIEAHIFISFLAYCLHVTLRRRLCDLAPGLTPRSVLEKFATIQMLDVHLPTDDDRTVILSRYTHPESDVQLLLYRLKLELPPQPPPKITKPKPNGGNQSVVKT
ncbi:MAG TPA: IS1634 family transposase [Candidatus Limnocylindrales bacterium]|jgi:transposase|nr:IS1634 family transposase [Candidatus Limnocylindrales bacterium]